jgi:hypothetical protein
LRLLRAPLSSSTLTASLRFGLALTECGHLLVLVTHPLPGLLFLPLSFNGIGRIFLANLHMAQDLDRLALQIIEQFSKQAERFPLVFLPRILATITPQEYPLAQVIHGSQVFFPQAIQYL